MLPSPTELQYFVEVAHALNISRAAERLGVSQPTLSLAIQRLEASTGVSLLLRGKSGVRLTQGGQKLVAQARTLLAEWEKIRGDALKDESQARGRYTIGCHPSVALYSLPDFAPQLLRDNPRLELKLVHDLSRRITEEVISFKIDFGIVVNPPRHPELVMKLLCTDVVSFWIGPETSTLQDARGGEGVVVCDPDLLQTQHLLKQAAKQGLRFGRTVSSGNLEVITALVAAGTGVGILPTRVAKLSRLGLRLLDKSAPKFHDRIYLVYRADAQSSKASRSIARSIEAGVPCTS